MKYKFKAETVKRGEKKIMTSYSCSTSHFKPSINVQLHQLQPRRAAIRAQCLVKL